MRRQRCRGQCLRYGCWRQRRRRGAGVAGGLRPDIVILCGAPRRLRWRSPCAELAYRLGLFYVAGGQPGLGNMIAVSHRVRVLDTWCVRYPLVPGQAMRGAVLAKLAVGDTAASWPAPNSRRIQRNRPPRPSCSPVPCPKWTYPPSSPAPPRPPPTT